MAQITWASFHQGLQGCSRCGLRAGCARVVPGEGRQDAPLMFVGEGPGQEEDRQGRPFVGAAGQLLDRMIGAMGLERRDVYICNVVKCRPPYNRQPTPEEQEACLPFLRAQFLLVRPAVIVCLGATAAQALLDREIRISRARGTFIQRKGVYFMPTYHPAALLRQPELKRDAWMDLQAVRKKLMELRLYADLLYDEPNG